MENGSAISEGRRQEMECLSRELLDQSPFAFGNRKVLSVAVKPTGRR